MINIKRIELDVLKPHHPNTLEFASEIAEKSPGANVELTVLEVDEMTETVILIVSGQNIDFQAVTEAITQMGGSVHSIDKVSVVSDAESSL